MFAPISRVESGTAHRPGGRLAVLLLALFGVVVLAIWHDLDGVPSSLPMAAQNGTPHTLAWADMLPDLQAVALAEVAEEAAASQATASDPQCDSGRTHPDDDQGLPQGDGNEAPGDTTAKLRRLAANLSISRDERMRAAGLLLQARLATDVGAVAVAARDDASCRQAQRIGLQDTAQFCADSLARTEAALWQPGASAVDRLANLAAGTQDPVVYAMAYQVCHPPGLTYHVPEAHCEMLSASQWARLDPDNAVPWLQLAALAGSDGEALDNALRHAAGATRVESHAGALAAQVAPLAGAFAEPLQAPWPYLETAASRCSAVAVAEPLRAAACNSLARLLVSRGPASADVLAGVQIGERLGWPAEETSLISRTLPTPVAPAGRQVAGPSACEGGVQRR